VLEVRVGDQVVADGVLVEAAGLEVDESLLSGETLAVSKAAGDEVWSGSVVVAGSGTMQVSRNTHKLESHRGSLGTCREQDGSSPRTTSASLTTWRSGC
jgi:P-type E1-E2 ATPase